MSRKAVLERTLGKKAAKKFLPVPKKQVATPVTLEVDCDLVEQVVVQELIGLHTSLSRDLKDRKAGKKDRKSTRLNSSHVSESRMPSSA